MTRLVLSIDPGSVRSGWLVLRDGIPAVVATTPDDYPVGVWGIAENVDLVESLRVGGLPNGLLSVPDVVVIEFMSPRGMPTSREEMEALWWAGRFAEAAYPAPAERLTRDAIKRHLCGRTAKVGDANVRAALIDRFGGIEGKDRAIGRKAKPGPLYGIANDVWSALAVAVAWEDGAR